MALPVYSDVEVKGKVVVDDKVTVGDNVFTKDNLDEPIFNYAEKSIKLDKIIGKEIEITDGNTKITNNGIETVKSVLVKTGIDNKYSLIYKTAGFQSPVVFGEPGNYIEYPANDVIGSPVEFKLNNVTRYDNGDIKSLKYITLIEKYNSFRLELKLEKSSIDFILSKAGSRFTFNNYNDNSYIIEMSYVSLGKDTYQIAYEITRSAATTSQDLNSLYTFSNNFSVYIEPTAIAYVYDTKFYSEYAYNHLKTNEVYAQELISVADTVVIDNSGIKIKDNNIVEYNSEENRTVLQNIDTANIDTVEVNNIYIPFGEEKTKPLCYGTKFISFTMDNNAITSTNFPVSDQMSMTTEFYMGGIKNTFTANLGGLPSSTGYRIINSSISNMYFTISFNNGLEGENIYLINLNIADPKDIVELKLKGNYNYNFELFLDIKSLITRLLYANINNDTNFKHKAKITVTSSFGTLSPSESVVFLEEYCTDFSGQQFSSYKKHHLTPSNNEKEIGLPVSSATIETLYISRPYI